jgi:hypothetical protein
MVTGILVVKCPGLQRLRLLTDPTPCGQNDHPQDPGRSRTGCYLLATLGKAGTEPDLPLYTHFSFGEITRLT